MVASRPYSQRPPRVAYSLTEDGRELAGVLRLLASWGAGGSEAAEALRHLDCGSRTRSALVLPNMRAAGQAKTRRRVFVTRSADDLKGRIG